MKKNSTKYATRILGFTLIALMAMLNPAFSQEPAVDFDLLTFSMAVSPDQKVKFRLPLDMRSGDRITGTVIEVKKNKAGELNKASSTLEGVVIEIDGKQTKLSNRLFSFIVPAGITSLPFLLKNAAGEILEKSHIPLIDSAFGDDFPIDFSHNNIGQPGQPLNITGPFDGNASNTNVTLNNQPCEIIAESPRMTIFEVPQDATPGVSNLKVEENSSKEEHPINIIQLDLSAKKTTLLKGEKTTVTVKVSGLEGLDYTKSDLKLRLENQSPQTIVFLNEPSNIIIKEINAESVKNGIYVFSTRISAIKKGAYAVSGKITSPKDDNECVKKYQDCMAKIKADKETAIQKCQDAGGAGVADCIAQINTESAKLEKACFDDFLKCHN